MGIHRGQEIGDRKDEGLRTKASKAAQAGLARGAIGRFDIRFAARSSTLAFDAAHGKREGQGLDWSAEKRHIVYTISRRMSREILGQRRCASDESRGRSEGHCRARH